MKSLVLFILTFLTLYNPKVQANLYLGVSPYKEALSNYDILETEVDSIPIITEAQSKDIDKNLENFIKLVKIFKYFQGEQTILAQKLLLKVQNHNTLSGDELYLLKRGFEVFSKMNTQMLNFGDLYEPKLSIFNKILGRRNLNKKQIKANLIWLNAHLLTLSHIATIHDILYKQDSDLRRILKNILKDNLSDEASRKRIMELSEQVDYVVNVGKSEDLRDQLFLVQEINQELKAELEKDPLLTSLMKEILENETAMRILEGRDDFNISGYGFEDFLVSVFQKVSNILSGFFGNVMGSMKSRLGYLYRNELVYKRVSGSLRPLDILLEKSPFVATDKFIPGHFGHVALYLGTKEQLQEIGMWSHPSIVPYQDDISAGKIILEAVRPGVRLTSLSEFLNIDELVVMRKNDALASTHKISEQLARGMEQLGKSYDFNFDISTLDKIVCSELIYIVFGHVNWPSRYRFDRPTVTPDDLSEVLFMKNTRFFIADYILSTKRHKMINPGLERLAQKFNFELRAEDGSEVKDPEDLTNSYWKKETKCYTLPLSDNKKVTAPMRKCKTTYKEFTYEESGS